jgi:enoyl-[acyl-carrier-protein] reductase (NADH)
MKPAVLLVALAVLVPGVAADSRHVDADDVGAAAAYLLSDDAKNVTGTTLYVDSGYHAMGM